MKTKRVALTGATGGLGRIVLPDLARDHEVVALHRGGAGSAIESTGAEMIAVDFSDSRSIRSALTSARPDAVVHLAGGWAGGSLESTDDDTWSSMMDSNLHSAFRVIREAAAVLPEEGRVVVIGSTAAIDEPAGMIAYTVAKSALLTLVRVAAREVPRLRINAIAPAAIDTSGSGEGVAATGIAATIRFLLGEDARGITGTAIVMR